MTFSQKKKCLIEVIETDDIFHFNIYTNVLYRLSKLSDPSHQRRLYSFEEVLKFASLEHIFLESIIENIVTKLEKIIKDDK